MASFEGLVAFAILAILPFYASCGETCLSPSATTETYTTSLTTMSSETIVIVEFSVDCRNKLKNMNLYAEFEGSLIPVTRFIGDDNKYQVTYSTEHKKLPSGTYSMRVYDEEGYAHLRKAQRSGDDVESIKSLFTVDVEHKGASAGPIVQSEVVATGAALIVWYLAFVARSKILA